MSDETTENIEEFYTGNKPDKFDWRNLLSYLSIAFVAFILGMAQSTKNIQNDCNEFINEKVFTPEVLNCLGYNVPIASSEHDFINISEVYNSVNNAENNTTGE